MLDSPFKARGPGPVDPSFTRLEEEDSRPSPPLVLVAFLFPAFAGFNFGFDIGSTSGAIRVYWLGECSVNTESGVETVRLLNCFNEAFGNEDEGIKALSNTISFLTSKYYTSNAISAVTHT